MHGINLQLFNFAQIAQKNCSKLKFRFMRNFPKNISGFAQIAQIKAQNRAKIVEFHAQNSAKVRKKKFGAQKI